MTTIHKAGTKIVIFSALFFIALGTFVFYFFESKMIFIATTIFLTAKYLFVIRFFRSPKRAVNISDNVLVAPADGTIVAIEETVETEVLKAPCIQVSIFMSVWNVHINWIPISGILRYFKYHSGKFFIADNPKSSELNERTTLMIEHEGQKIVIRQIAGFVARRIETYTTQIDTNISAGQQMGFIKFGSRVDIFLPLDSEILVKMNQKTKGCITSIAKI